MVKNHQSHNLPFATINVPGRCNCSLLNNELPFSKFFVI